MTLQDVPSRLEKGEDLHTEFKQWPIQADDLASSLVAFANTDGGEVLLGVDDQGGIVGIAESDLDRATQFVDNVAFQNCEPPVTVLQETFRNEQGRAILLTRVPKGDQRPYRTNRGVHYIRTSSGRRQASREELLRLFQATETLYYDEVTVRRSTTADLDERALEDLLALVRERGLDLSHIPTDRLLRNWRLTGEADGQIHPTLAGLLFLARFPAQFLPCAYVSALCIQGRNISIEPLDQKRIEGRLVDKVQDAMRFLSLYLKQRHEIRALEPELRLEGNEFVVSLPRPSPAAKTN